jgi:hypothetical protein
MQFTRNAIMTHFMGFKKSREGHLNINVASIWANKGLVK